MTRPLPSLVGERFERLTVVRETAKLGPERAYECLCDCGETTIVRMRALRKGTTRSCGCLRREITGAQFTRHGHATGGLSPTYRSWTAMRSRCTNPNYIDYERYYGGRGITVCDRWASFENFLADMGERPEGMTLDRIDPAGNYEPGNCRWATPAQQTANRRVA